MACSIVFLTISVHLPGAYFIQPVPLELGKDQNAGSYFIQPMSDPTKAEQRAEIERLTADYDGRVIRTKREARERVQMVCPACRARRIVSSLGVSI